MFLLCHFSRLQAPGRDSAVIVKCHAAKTRTHLSAGKSKTVVKFGLQVKSSSGAKDFYEYILYQNFFSVSKAAAIDAVL